MVLQTIARYKNNVAKTSRDETEEDKSGDLCQDDWKLVYFNNKLGNFEANIEL